MGSPVRADFDRIALLPADGFDNNAAYHDHLLRFLPARLGESLDVGCGTGQFTRRLAARADRVTGLDFSANMIAAARRHSSGFSNIDYQEADVLTWDWPAGRLDCIASVATMHHLPMAEVLRRMQRALRPGGVLVMLDLRRSVTASDHLLRFAAYPVHLTRRLVQTGRLQQDVETRRAWQEHEKTDRFPTLDEVRRICDPILPGAGVQRLLLWRYSMVWRKL
jgi:SAM-dependent methyltransferase